LTSNLGASVRQRLLNLARSQERPFQELLQYYAMERFLYRLSKSRHAETFILKGALLLAAWQAPLSRVTKDIDLLGRTSNELGHIRALFAQLCQIECEGYGIEFDSKSVKVARIKEDADYEGVRVHFRAALSRAQIPMQIDIGFGDVVNPGVTKISYPTLLEFTPPELRAYPKETVVAEKLEAVTALEMLNSRMKDFFDLWALSRMYGFDGPVLLKAIKATFDHRGTAIEARPVGLQDEFANDRAKSTQWTAFLRRSRLSSAPVQLHETILAVRDFAGPPLSAASTSSAFNSAWKAGGPWSI
jgi:predicted nucleotidyltransferase component of viral defense system